MKNTLIITSSLIALSSSAFAEIPTGSLSINRSMIAKGDVPRLSWSIQYPTTVEDVIDITPDGEITSKTKLKVEVYMIGTAVSNHRTTTYTDVKVGSANWHMIYEGKGINLNPLIVRYTTTIEKGEIFRSSAIAYGSSIGWVYNDQEESLVMKNGDVPNSKRGWGGDASMEDYIRPYLLNGKLNIGPRDLLIAAELTHSAQYSYQSGYDNNDSIILVRFSKAD